MDHQRSQRIGLLSILLLIIVTISIVWLYFIKPHYYTYYIYTTDSVSGLMTSAPVEYKGVEIGYVKNIELFNHDWVKVELHIQKKPAITDNSAAIIDVRGLTNRGYTGYVYIELVDAPKRLTVALPPSINEKHVLPLLSSMSFGVDKTLKGMSDNFAQISRLLNSLLDDKTVLTVKELLTSLENVIHILERHDEQLTSLLINTAEASSDMKPLFRSGSMVMSSLDQQFLPEVHESLGKLNLLSDSLLDLTDKLNQNPAVVIRGTRPPKRGPGER